MNDLYSFKNQYSRFTRDINKWSVWVVVLGLVIGLPVFTIVLKLFDGPGDMWGHIVKYLLGTYMVNTLILIIGCTLLSGFFGVFSAWFVSQYEFPMRRQLEWFLILPLAIPSYITAYAYTGILEYGGSLQVLLRHIGIHFSHIDMMNIGGLILVLSISLFPYVYVSSRVAFLNQSAKLKEASYLLGSSHQKYFFRVALLLARPAIVGGMILVIMEVLNDYGAAQYYGVNTFTTGIFRSWFSLNDPKTAIYLSAILVSIIFMFLIIEKWQRGKKSYATHANLAKWNIRTTLFGRKRTFVSMIVWLPVLLGFVLPLLQLVYWAFMTFHKVFDMTFVNLLLQSFGVAVAAGVLTTAVAIILISFTKWSYLKSIKPISRLTAFGYAIPGAIIAIGVLIPTLAMDKFLIGFMGRAFSFEMGLLINGTIVALIYAYLVRFLTVAYNPIEAGTLRTGKHLSESSLMLGTGRFKTLFNIELPLLKTSIISAFVLVFIDVLKELPLTLILKPYHVQTLAVKAYEYAGDEMVAEAALPSLCIIITCVLVIRFLNRKLNA